MEAAFIAHRQTFMVSNAYIILAMFFSVDKKMR